MLYDYTCEECSHEMKDVSQSIKDDALTTCPNCGKETLQRVIYGGLGSFMKGTNTIGSVMDRSWANKGHYERSEIEEKSKAKEVKEPLAHFGPASRKDIMKMNDKQKLNYIMTGEK